MMRKYAKKGFVFVYVLLFVLILNGCSAKYSKETDPHKYLEFGLLEDNTYAVTGFSGDFVQDVTIPSMHNGIPVTRVSSYAFILGHSFFGIPPKHLPIETLIIEEGITHIEEFAFESNGIQHIQLPESLVYIGQHAFFGNYAHMNLPENLAFIGEGAFAHAKFEGEVLIKDIEIEAQAFYQAEITHVTFEEGIESIPYGMFGGVSKLESVELPQTLVSIGSSAFEGTINLREISFPDSLLEIGDHAFAGSGLTKLTFHSSITIGDAAFRENDLLSEVTFDHPDITMGDDAFGYNPLLNDVHYNDLIMINPKAFRFSPMNGQTVSTSNEHYHIIDGALANEDGEGYKLILGGNQLTDFSKFKSIGLYAFYGREFLDLHIPSNILNIEPYAFSFSKFENLTIDAIEIKQYAFYYAIVNGTVEISSEIIHPDSFNYATGFND